MIEHLENQAQELARSKKRIEKEIHDAKTYSLSKYACEVLEVGDSIARCEKMAKELASVESTPYLEGVLSLKSHFLATLAE